MSKDFWKKKKSKLYTHKKQEVPIQKRDTIDMWTFDKGKTSNLVKISTWNVNGIRSMINQRRLVPYLQKNQIDIICLNQTKIDYDAFQKTPIKIHGYSQYWNFCKCSSGYSGVAIFSKFLPISMTEDLPNPKHCQEGRIITLQFQKFYLVAVYFPNSGRFLTRLNYRIKFDIDFYEYCQSLKKKKHVIICGDLNVVRDQIDIYKSQGKVRMSENMPSCSQHERNAFKDFLKKGWIDIFRQLNPEQVKYSWWDNQIQGRKNGVGWRIDYFVVSKEILQSVKSCNIRCQIQGSDHCPNLKSKILENQKEKLIQKEDQENVKKIQELKKQENQLIQQKLVQKQNRQNKQVLVGSVQKTKDLVEKQKIKEIPFILKNRDRCTTQ